MSLPRITFITNLFPSPKQPSLGTFVENSCVSLRDLGRDVEVVALGRESSALVSYAQFYRRGFLSLRRSDGIAYVHYVSHSAPPAILARIVNRRLRVALHFHGSDAFPEVYESRARGKLKRLICRLAIRSADIIVAPSETFADRLSEELRIPRNKLSVSASAGVDTSVFQNAVRPKRQTKHILFAGRMISGKGATVAARTFKALLDERSDLHATLIGIGPEREAAEAILRDEVAGGRVSFLDPVDQRRLAGHYQDADVLIFPSTRKGESLGLVLIEAIFCGAVPIAFDNPTTRSVLGGVSTRLLAGNEHELQLNLRTLVDMSAAELQAINAQLRADNAHFEKGEVARGLNRILT